MNAEQLHEIYDNNGTLIGYETIEADATGRFTRYDEHMSVLGYAKDAGDLIYHYDRSMRFIGYARMEDGVLREYDLNSNVVGYQSRLPSDMQAPLANDPQDQRQAPPDAFSFTDSTSVLGSGHDTVEGASSGPSPIYATSKAYSFTGSDWFGSGKTNNRDNKSSRATDEDEADSDGDGDSDGEIDLDTAETSLNDLPSAFAQRYNNDGSFANAQSRNDSHYDGPSTFDFHAPNVANAAYGDPYVDHAQDADPGAQEQTFPWQSQSQSPYNNKGPKYAVRGEIVDDVDEFGNEINPEEQDMPSTSSLPSSFASSSSSSSSSPSSSSASAPSSARGQANAYYAGATYAGATYADSAHASPNEPMARPSPFAKKPSLLQRLISRVMPFTANKPVAAAPAPVRRGGFAALPAPDGAAVPPTDEATPAWPSQQTQYAHAGYGQPYGEIDPDSLGEEEKFDPLAEMKLIWQKINYYAQQILPKRKPREDDSSLFDLRDSLAADAPPGDPFSQSNTADTGYGNPVDRDREDLEPATPESTLGSASESSFAEAPSFKWQPRSTLLALKAFLMAIPAQLAPLPVRLMKAALRAIQTPQWLWWMTATALGTIAFGMVRLFIPPIGDIPAWIYTGLYGLMIGVSQWAMLRHRYRTTWHWVIVSALAGVASALLTSGELGWLHGRSKAAPIGEVFSLYLLIGSMQWLLLRNLSNRSIAWLILTPLAGLAGWLGYTLGAQAGYIAALSVHGLAIGAVSGFALAPVIEERSPKAIFQLPSTANIVGLVATLTGGIRALSAAIALGGLLEAASGSISAVTQGGAAQQTPMLLALLSVYPARLFVSLTTMGSALSFRQSESSTSRAWLVGAAMVGILIEVIAQAVLPEMVRPDGSLFFIAANLIVLLLIDALTTPPPATEPSTHTTLISLSAIGMLASGLLIFFGSIFLAAHSINIDLMATASMTASEIGFSLSMATLLSLLRVGLSAFAIFVALRLPGERSNGWADVPMGILAIGAATFGPMLLESNNSNNDMYWLVPIALAGTALVMGMLRNTASFGGPLPTKPKDDESTVRNAPRLVPVGLLICALSIGVVLTRNGAWETLRRDPRLGVVTAKVQDLTSGVTAKIKQIKLPTSMDEVQKSTSGLQKTVSGIMTQLEPTPEPTADWPPASK